MEQVLTALISMETYMVLRGVLPCFMIALIGYFLGKWDEAAHEVTINRLTRYVFLPALVFSSIHKHPFSLGEPLVIFCATIAVVVGMLPFACLLKRQAGVHDGNFYLPMLFMASGSVALPLAMVVYGNEGLAKAIWFHLTILLLFNTLGTYLGKGKIELANFFRTPALYAALLGVAAAVAPVEIPESMQEFVWLAEKGIDIIGYGGLPLLLISFGYPLSKAKGMGLRRGVLGGVARIVAGPAVAFLVISLYRHSGVLSMERGYDVLGYLDRRTTEAVIILCAAIPGSSAGMHAGGERSDDAPSMLVTGALCGIVSLPVVLILVNLLVFS